MWAATPTASPLDAGADATLLDDTDGDSAVATPERRESTISAAQHSQRLDKALVALAPEFSRNHLQGLLEQGHALLDGQARLNASHRVRAGQRLLIVLVPTEESLAFRPQAMVLDVLFEDEQLLVVNKPVGLVVHPAPGNWSGTLLNGLLARQSTAAALPRAGIVHRLDKDTSGVMVVGKTLQAVTALSRDIAARTVHRRYVAIAHGVPAQQHFSIEAPIGRDLQVRVRMAVVAGGRPSRTDVTVLAHEGNFSALSCQLFTGRTHQIRVHLAREGLPLVADSLYGGKAALGLQRQALHAVELRFLHPLTQQPLAFHCEPPADFAAAWALVAGGASKPMPR